MGHLENLSTDMKEIISDVKKGKGTFGSLLRDGELADEVKEAISSVNKLVSRESIPSEQSYPCLVELILQRALYHL